MSKKQQIIFLNNHIWKKSNRTFQMNCKIMVIIKLDGQLQQIRQTKRKIN